MDYDRDSRPDPVDHCDVCDNEFEAVACRHCITYRDDLIEQARADIKALREAAAAVINTLPSMILCDHRDCTEPATFVTSDKHLCGAHNDGGDVLLTDFAISLRALQAVLAGAHSK